MSAYAVSPVTAPRRQRGDGFRQLLSSLDYGDLGAAQEAYQVVREDFRHAPVPPASPINDTLESGLGRIGAALQSGDLMGARHALEDMQQRFRGALILGR